LEERVVGTLGCPGDFPSSSQVSPKKSVPVPRWATVRQKIANSLTRPKIAEKYVLFVCFS
jgi:hypothetical protein